MQRTPTALMAALLSRAEWMLALLKAERLPHPTEGLHALIRRNAHVARWLLWPL